MGNYFRQIYTGSHVEWWTTVFDPRGQEKQRRFSRPPWVNSNRRMELKAGGGSGGEGEGGGRAATGVRRRLGD